MTSTDPLRIGGSSDFGEYFTGTIDEIRIYNRALSDAEIQTDMTTPIVSPTNRAPVVTSPGPQTGTVGVAVSPLAISATDPDGDPLTYAATGLPSGLTINTTSGVISGTVGAGASASNAVIVTVNDGRGGAASTPAFAWTIGTANRAPVLTNPGPQSGTEGVAVTPLHISATDPDGDSLTYSATGRPSGIAINATTGRMSGTVNFNAQAANTVTVTVSDGKGGTATATFTWTITLVNRAPVVTNPGPQSGTEGEAVTPPLAIAASDPDAGDVLTYSATGLPSGLAIATATGIVSGTVAGDAAASNTVQVSVTDANGASTTVTFAWTVAMVAPGTGLVAAYGFDEGLGPLTADASGTGNTATISGATWQAGRFGKSLAFDGISNWVTAAASASVNLTNAMTIEAWVYPTEADGWRTVVFKEAPGETWAHDYALYSTFGAEGPGGHVLTASQANAHAPDAIVLNRWTHLATTYDGQTLRSYVDGIQRAAVATTGPISISDGALRMGGNGMWGDFFKGRIDEVRLYNRALPAGEIQTDMATPVTGSLAAAYSFDDGAGSTVRDDAGHALTGTISGATWTTAGRFGGGMRFDGVNDWVTVADSSWLALGAGMTLEAWVYPTAPGGWRTVMMKQSVDWYTFALYSDGSVGPSVRAMGATDGGAASPALLPINQWSHLAATYDGTTLRLYVNGVAVVSTPFTGDLSTSTDPLRIGGNSVYGEYFMGVIDEVRVYSRPLTALEIQQDMARPIR